MKKVKIMLTAIAVFAVVGGAVAFKAKNYSFPLWYTIRDASTGFCTIPTNTLNVTFDANQPRMRIHSTNNESCPLRHTTIVEL